MTSRMFRFPCRIAGIVAVSFAVAALAVARDDIRSERVHFARGSDRAVVEASITGHEIVDYVLRAERGQRMSASLATDNDANFFNVLAPGENEAALFNGSLAQNRYEGALPESGDYKLRVYLQRSAARRQEKAKYRLEVTVTGPGERATGGVEQLQDLVGVRGRDAETQMQARGYRSVGGHAEKGAVVGYWRKGGDGGCVSVRTADGRYQAIAPATAEDCDRAESATRSVANADPGGYRTVCGVFVDGRPIRYVCSVVAGDQRGTPTTLRFPDMVMVLHWLDGGRVRIELEGMSPLEGTWSESEGETDLVTPEKTWFYVSDREAAAREVESMAR